MASRFADRVASWGRPDCYRRWPLARSRADPFCRPLFPTGDIVRFKFTNVDPGQYDRSFSFDIDASKQTYTRTLSPLLFLPPGNHRHARHDPLASPLLRPLPRSPFESAGLTIHILTRSAVAAISPAGFLPATTVDPLLAGLNQDRDFYGFAREMREALRTQVKEERTRRG